MNTGVKYALTFLGGMAAGAAGLALLNRGKLDFEYLKPICSDCMSKGMGWKDKFMAKFDAIKENMEDMAAEARDKADERKSAAAPKHYI